MGYVMALQRLNHTIVSWAREDDLKKIGDALEQGRLVAGSSDTVIGLLAAPTLEGRQALDSIKGRDRKPYIILIGGMEQVPLFAQAVSKQAHILMERCWSGPLTLILKAKDDLPSYLISDEGTVALRVPNHEGLLKLLMRFPALFSTSANKAGDPTPTRLEDLDPVLADNVALLIEGGANSVLPSTLVDATGDEIRIVREGAYSREVIFLNSSKHH